MIKVSGGALNPQEEKLLEQISIKALDALGGKLKTKGVLTFCVSSNIINVKRKGIIGFCMVRVDLDHVASCVCEFDTELEFGKWSYSLKTLHGSLSKLYRNDLVEIATLLTNKGFGLAEKGAYSGPEIPEYALAQIHEALKRPEAIGHINLGDSKAVKA